MSVKTYQAYSMAEALAAAKRDLGADAIILETRTFKRGGVLGVGRRMIFELTATSSDRAEIGSRAAAPARPQAARAARAYATRTTEAPQRQEAPGPTDFERTRRLAQALVEAHDRRQREQHGGERRSAHPETEESGAAPLAAAPTSTRTAPVARRFILTPAGQPATGANPAPTPLVEVPVGAGAVTVASPPTGTLPTAPSPVNQASSLPMHQELSAIKSMVGQVLQRQGAPGTRPDMPEKLFEMYLELVGQDLSEELAEQIVTAVSGELGDRVEDAGTVREAVIQQLAGLVPAADATIPRRSPDDRPLTIALIGPTGVGKTTTLAKLAASFKLRERRRVGLVTCDTYRIAAVDQLRTYANIIGLPLEVALSPPDMHRAVHKLSDCDVVLIDSAGRGPNDRGRLDELRECMDAARPHEIHLVLSSTASERVLLREAEAFADVGADRIVLTKLDEAVSFGVLVNVMQSVGKSLSCITTGQEVPDHIEAGRSRRLAELMLGAELHA